MACSRVLVIVGVVGAFLGVLGGVSVLLVPKLFSAILNKKLPIENNTEVFKLWSNIPLPIYQKFYFFNLTNPVEFVNNGAKPKLQEVGPYCYSSSWVKTKIAWNPNGTVSYREVKTFHFVRNMSVGSEKDIITTINAPLVAAGVLLRTVSIAKRIAFSIVINQLNEHLVVKHTIGELLYAGYPDILVTTGRLIDPGLPFKDGKFGWMHERNSTDDGLYTVYTGKNQMEKYNIISRWNGNSNLSWWNGTCNMINGTNGELSPPLVQGQTTVELFNPDFCRSISLVKNETVESHGIVLQRFLATASTFKNGNDDPSNSCFDTKRHMHSGAMDISPCQHRLPIALSFPHFYMADPFYLSKVEGLKPDAVLHRLSLDMEPNLGITLGLSARVQINIILERYPIIKSLANIPELTYPILWQEMNLVLDSKTADHLKNLLERPLFYSVLFSYLILGLGTLLLFGVLAYIVGRKVWKLVFLKGDSSTTSLVGDFNKFEEAAAKENGADHGDEPK